MCLFIFVFIGCVSVLSVAECAACGVARCTCTNGKLDSVGVAGPRRISATILEDQELFQSQSDK